MQILRTAIALISALVGMLLALPVLLGTLLFWAVARVTQMLATRLEPRFLPWRDLVEFDDSVGWVPKSNVDVHYFAVRDPEVFHVVTDGEGWPGTAPIAECDLVVFGDSLAFGFGVDSTNSFVHVRPELRVKAIAAPGYNTVQELLLMRKFSDKLAGKVVVWFLYYGNDLYDNLQPEMSRYRTPFVHQVDTPAGWEIVTHHVRSERWHSSAGRAATDWLAVLAALHSPSDLSRRAFSACEFLIREGQRICDEVGARLVVLGIPSPRTLSPKGLEKLAAHCAKPDQIQADLPDCELRQICEDLGVSFVAARDHLSIRDYRPVDDHWNERGHRRIADLLLEIRDRHEAPIATSAVAHASTL